MNYIIFVQYMENSIHRDKISFMRQFYNQMPPNNLIL